jgi:hypothetical protein
MPKPQLANGQAFLVPPLEIREKLGQAAYEYFLMIHHLLFSLDPAGVGVLDEKNVTRAVTADTADTATSAGTADHANLTNVQPYQHHGANLHSDLDQSGIVTDAPDSAVAVTSADAGTFYTTAVRDLINETKADVNTLVSDVNTINAKVSELIDALQAAGLMGT